LSPQVEAQSIKFKNIIDMAISFTAMTRVFKEGSKQRIAAKLENTLGSLSNIDGKDEFEKIHSDFCEWFVRNISTARRVRKDKRIKESGPASYGQAGKVFDVALKVYIYYCQYPDCETALRLMPLLHAGIDTKMMKALKEDYPEANIQAETIEAISKSDYVSLQNLVVKHIEDKFQNQIMPVQYDDIMWYRLNRGT
jgi:hypothetical protein